MCVGRGSVYVGRGSVYVERESVCVGVCVCMYWKSMYVLRICVCVCVLLFHSPYYFCCIYK